MKSETYFERLKTHPGIEFGVIFPILGFFAGASNPTAKGVELFAGLCGFVVLALFCWPLILISNRERK